MMLSRGPPKADNIQSRDEPKPRVVSQVARSQPALPSRTRQMILIPCASSGINRSNGAACNPMQTVVSSGQPSREAAREKVEGDGCAIHSSGESWDARLAPAPCQKGSPEASTAVGRPRFASTQAASNGTGHGLPRPSMAASLRWRSPPNTVSALASAFRLASDSPARPSSPIPMMVNQGPDRGSATMRALILGGTGDANQLADRFVREKIDAVYSYAGRTQIPLGHSLPTRIGGFGGVVGLADFIRQENITHVIDATHPFAAEMSRRAVEACAATGIPLVALERAPWGRVSGDYWIEVTDINSAVAALPEKRARVFLAIGRQHIAPFATKPQHA